MLWTERPQIPQNISIAAEALFRDHRNILEDAIMLLKEIREEYGVSNRDGIKIKSHCAELEENLADLLTSVRQIAAAPIIHKKLLDEFLEVQITQNFMDVANSECTLVVVSDFLEHVSKTLGKNSADHLDKRSRTRNPANVIHDAKYAIRIRDVVRRLEEASPEFIGLRDLIHRTLKSSDISPN